MWKHLTQCLTYCRSLIKYTFALSVRSLTSSYISPLHSWRHSDIFASRLFFVPCTSLPSQAKETWRNNELSGIKAEPHPLGLLVNLRIVASKTGQCCITVVESQECRAKLKPLLKVKVVREFVIIFHEISHIQQV